MNQAAKIKSQRVATIGADPAPREERPRGFRPAPKPRATHAPVKTAEARHGGGHGGGGRPASAGRPGGGGARRRGGPGRPRPAAQA